jgi:hypothetical protein
MAYNQVTLTIESMKEDMIYIVDQLEGRISMLDLIMSSTLDRFNTVNQTRTSLQRIPKDVIFAKMIFIRDVKSLLNKYNVMLHGSHIMVGAKELMRLLCSKPLGIPEEAVHDRNEYVELFMSREPLYASIRARYRPLLDSIIATEQPNANNANGNEKVSHIQFHPSTKSEGGRRRTRRSRTRRTRR